MGLQNVLQNPAPELGDPARERGGLEGSTVTDRQMCVLTKQKGENTLRTKGWRTDRTNVTTNRKH
jgi:hypothetical protein